MLCQCFQVNLKSGNIALTTLHLLREGLEKIVLQTVLLALVVGFHQLQPRHVNVQVHFFLDALIPGAQSLDLRVGESCFVNVLAGSHRRFARHNLGNEFLFVFQSLPQIGIEGCLRHITVDMHLRIHVPLPDDAPAALFQITGTPWGIQIMQGNEPVLHVHTGTHLKGTSHQDAHLSCPHFGKQFFFADFCVGVMDKGNLFSWNARSDELAANVLINRKFRHSVRKLLIHHSCHGMKFRAIDRAICLCDPGLCGSSFGSGKITENKLRQFVFVSVSINAHDIVHTHVDLAGRIVGEIRVDNTLVKPQLPTIRCDFEHVILRRVNISGVDAGRPLGELLYHLFLYLRRLRHNIVIDRRRRGKIELI